MEKRVMAKARLRLSPSVARCAMRSNAFSVWRPFSSLRAARRAYSALRTLARVAANSRSKAKMSKRTIMSELIAFLHFSDGTRWNAHNNGVCGDVLGNYCPGTGARA